MLNRGTQTKASILQTTNQTGFSLLEMLVAIVILSFSLGALYNASSGATRIIGKDEKYVFALELAKSLAALNRITPEGFQSSGETQGGFIWSVVVASPDVGGHRVDSSAYESQLLDMTVSVSWDEGEGGLVELNTIAVKER